MQRILVIGPCGAGKSTLARALGAKLGLPIFHMDQLNWKPGWKESSKDEILERLSSIVATDRWVIDGNYGGTLAERLERADTVLYLDYPIRLCVARLFRRIWMYRGETRPDMTEGCPERFDLGFLFYLLQWRSGPGPRTEAKLASYKGMLIRFNKPRDLQQWIETIGSTG
jgi:adenylate kinase family enzyme